MKYLQMLGLLAAAIAAVLAFVGTASALITYPPGVPFTGQTHVVAQNSSFDGSVKVSCSSSTWIEHVTNGSTFTEPTIFAFSGCGTDTVSALRAGTLSIASNGVVTSNGAEITVQLHRSVLGFPVTTHCIYKTNGTSIGTLTEGVSPAVLHIGSSPIPEVATDGACGNDAVWTGTYTVTTPSSAIVVD